MNVKTIPRRLQRQSQTIHRKNIKPQPPRQYNTSNMPETSMEKLRSPEYFAPRVDREMSQRVKFKTRELREHLAVASRILALKYGDAGLAGQISARSERDANYYWTLRFGLGFEEATVEDFIGVDRDLNTVSGEGIPNPATRFHLWVYEARPDINSIVHTHSPYAAILAASRQPLVVSPMDQTPLYDNCGFLPEWPGLPIADHEGLIISTALGDKGAIILAHHGQLTAGRSVSEAAFLSVCLERSAKLQVESRVFGPPVPVDGELAKVARDFQLKDRWINATFDYWARQAERAFGPLSEAKSVYTEDRFSNGVKAVNGVEAISDT